MKEIIQITNPNMSHGAVMGAIIFILSRAGYHIQKTRDDIHVFGTETFVFVHKQDQGDVSPWSWIAKEIVIRCSQTTPVAQQIVDLIQKELPTMLILE